jgi:ATP-dependent RNA helicase DeaD
METLAGRLPAALERALSMRGYPALRPVQRAMLEDVVRGADLIVSAPTGSGKTVAFGLALTEHLVAADGTLAASADPRALVIVPTRELARQVAGELTWLLGALGARVGCLTGGTDPRAERRLLARGLDVVVGSAGRLRDHVARRALAMGGMGCVVLDEADDMLSRGFRADLEFLLDAAPAGRRTLMFSATITPEVERLAGRYQRAARRLDVGAGPRPGALQGMVVPAGARETAVGNVLRWHEARAALVFCGRRDAVGALARRLVQRGFAAVALSGALGQRERDGAMAALVAGRARVCVATDLAARGLDLPGLDLVINADLPASPEALLHRAGRSGRDGAPAAIVLIAAQGERRRAARLAEGAGLALEWVDPPGAESIRRRDLQRLLASFDAGAPDLPDGPDVRAAVALLTGRAPERLAAALVRHWLAARPAGEALCRRPTD